ncbi:outer membrane beta-barrel protein [uncultured Muribaculum sp.]|jgi:hypothetical protein|uniref:outer membrane beta-barrel protein n=6 Tax=Muribaculum TaxID=1918540 RepID=UPI0025897245|nr:outer membrane beta-barrel protein [uncultured Muribaculum sp.]
MKNSSLLLIIGFSFIMSCLLMCDLHASGNASARQISLAPADTVNVDSIKPAVSLDEVTVKASTISHRGTRDSYMITQDMKRGLRTAGELLMRVNGAFYNPVSHDLTYLGSSNIVLLVDSMERGADYIKRQSPNRFDRIDVVHQPTGKYSGYDALINFHTRPTYRGSEFNIGGNTWIRPDGVNGRGRDFNKTSPWADFTYTEDKWNVQADASWQWEQSGMSTYTTRTFPLNNYEERMLEQDPRDPTDLMRRRSLALETAVDYRINDRHIVSALVGVSTTGFDRTLKSRMVTGNINSVLRDTIGHMSRLIENNYLGWAFGIYHRGLVGKWNINTSLTYNTSAWDYKRNVSRTSGYSVDDLRRKSSDYFWGNFSAYRTLFGGKAGLDLSETLLSMDYKEKRLGTDIVLSNNSVISSTTYASLQYFPSNKLSLTANVGVFVYHNSEGDTHTTSVKPRLQANAFWRPSKKFVTQLVYSASSSSPNLIQMSGYGQFTDSLEYQSGNPSLKATTTHSVMLNLTFFSSLTLSTTFTHGDGSIYDITEAAYMNGTSGERIPYAVTIPENGHFNQWKFRINYNKRFSDRLESALAGSLTGTTARYMNYRREKWIPTADWYMIYRVAPIAMDCVLSYGIIGSSSITPQSRYWELRDGFGLALQKNFLNNRLQLSVLWSPDIHFMPGKTHTYRYSPALNTVGWSDANFRSNNMINFYIAYRLARGKKVRNYKHQTHTVE